MGNNESKEKLRKNENTEELRKNESKEELKKTADTYRGSPLAEGPYPITKKGLFVIISNTDFEFEFRLSKTDVWTEDQRSNTLMKEAHTADMSVLAKMFHAIEQHSSGNVIYVHNATNDESENNFDKVIEDRVLGHKGEPSFLLFFLFSHGLTNGNFLLGNSTSTSCNARATTCGAGEHAQVKSCLSRNVRKHIIDKIEKSKKFLGVPKVYFIHACRGAEKEVHKLNPQMMYESGISFNKARYDAYGADTWIIYPCIQNHPAYNLPNGSLIVQKLQEVTKKLIDNKEKVAEFYSKTTELWRKEIMSRRTLEDGHIALDSLLQEEGFPPLQLNVTTLAGEWIDDVCVRVSQLVANELHIQNTYQPLEDGTFKKTKVEPLEISQPEVISTLRRKLSWMDMINSYQLPDK